MRNTKILVVSLLLCLGLTSQCWAASATATLTIDSLTVTAGADNPYGLHQGDCFEWFMAYDESKLMGSGREYLSLQADPSLAISGRIGSLSVKAQDALLYPQTAPALLFTDGVLEGFANFTVYDAPFGVVNMMSGNRYQSLNPLKGMTATGSFTFTGNSVHTPIPSSMGLLSLGLVLLSNRIRKGY